MNSTFEQAITFHREGKIEEAKRLYRVILNTQPEHLDANNNLGVILQYQGKLEQAKECYKKAIELKPDLSEAHNNLGFVFKEQGRLDEAEASYRKAIKLKPNYAAAHNNLVNTLFELGRLDEAEVSCKKTIKLKPDYAEAHNNLGGILYHVGRLDEAQASYKKAIELKPDYEEVHINLGIVLHKLGKLDEAEASYKKVIELKPDYADAYNNLGAIKESLNRLDEAITFFNKAIEFNPNFIEAILNRGKALFKKGQYESALKDFDNCKDSKESRSQTLNTLYALGRTEEVYKRIGMQFQLDDKDLRIAAFSAFITAKEKRETKYDFCNNPLEFIYTSNIKSHFKNSNLFINELIEDLLNLDTYWEPYGKSTKKGFQSNNILFVSSSERLKKLKSIIMNELDLYYSKFKDEDCSFIKKWPSKKDIYGWHVILKQQGYQNAHMHPSGWLSGVIYLKVVPPYDKNEGGIEFTLNGEQYSDPNSPKLIHQPKIGDIVFFPSSLHHRTIPFTTDTDRIIISFDLKPDIAHNKKL